MEPSASSVIQKHNDTLEKEAACARDFREAAVDGPNVRNALKVFGVSRSFPGIVDAEHRIAQIASEALAESRRRLGAAEPDYRYVYEQVDDLAEAFASETGVFSLSAASKLLWLGCGLPFVVYDQRARNALADLQSRSRPRTDYCAFHMDWRDEFNKVRDQLNTQPPGHMENWNALVADPHTPSDEFAARVFDKYLWEIGA